MPVPVPLEGEYVAIPLPASDIATSAPRRGVSGRQRPTSGRRRCATFRLRDRQSGMSSFKLPPKLVAALGAVHPAYELAKTELRQLALRGRSTSITSDRRPAIP